MEKQWKLQLGSTLASTFGIYLDGETIDNPNWKQIYHELLQLDGGITNDNVMLESIVGKGTLGIGGGDEGRYIVTYLPPEDHPEKSPLTLVDPSLNGPDIALTIQSTATFPSRYAVQFPLVINVVKHFFQTGNLPKNVHWEIGNTGKEANIEDW